jgi:prepilin-type N-terminal cleavage/methylation domain-containing protein
MTKNKSGFTLTELLIAIIIFSFMMISLATIYATSNRHMFQSYRENVVKSNLNIAMKTIQNAISKATRIDEPSSGASSNSLKVATNVDNNGCYPLVPGEDIEWHYFYLDVTKKILYHRYDSISTSAGATPCPTSGDIWNTNTYSTDNPETLLEYAVTDKDVMGEDFLFSRKQTSTQPKEKTEPDQVRVVLRMDWQPPKYDDIDLTKAARPIQVTFDTTVKPNITGQTP